MENEFLEGQNEKHGEQLEPMAGERCPGGRCHWLGLLAGIAVGMERSG